MEQVQRASRRSRYRPTQKYLRGGFPQKVCEEGDLLFQRVSTSEHWRANDFLLPLKNDRFSNLPRGMGRSALDPEARQRCRAEGEPVVGAGKLGRDPKDELGERCFHTFLHQDSRKRQEHLQYL